MNIVDIGIEVGRIEDAQRDDEKAHSMEDALYLNVLYGIADGSILNPRECAAVAIRTQAFDFERWCA